MTEGVQLQIDFGDTKVWIGTSGCVCICLSRRLATRDGCISDRRYECEE